MDTRSISSGNYIEAIGDALGKSKNIVVVITRGYFVTYCRIQFLQAVFQLTQESLDEQPKICLSTQDSLV